MTLNANIQLQAKTALRPRARQNEFTFRYEQTSRHISLTLQSFFLTSLNQNAHTTSYTSVIRFYDNIKQYIGLPNFLLTINYTAY